MQFADPEISRIKFQEELTSFLNVADAQRRRGVILLESKFPDMYFAFAATGLTPPPIAFAVRMNFENYDLVPISVSFINPFSYEPLKQHQILTFFQRNIGVAGQTVPQALLQQETSPDSFPFLCIPGVREYHDHPAHSGDSWLLHRKNSGEGSLGFLIDKMYQYGIMALNSYLIQAQLGTPQLMLGIDHSKLPS